MSIRSEIKAGIQDGRLVILRSTNRYESARRVLIMPSELVKGITNASSGLTAKRYIALCADLDRYIEGRFIDDAYMKPLSPRLAEEVWEIKSRRPEPSLRLLGRFAEKDVFVAFVCEERGPLGEKGSEEWKRVIRRTKAKWRTMFQSYTPHSGEHLHDYLSNAADPRFRER